MNYNDYIIEKFVQKTTKAKSGSFKPQKKKKLSTVYKAYRLQWVTA